MDLKVIYKDACYAVLEAEDGGTCEASRVYCIHLNGEFIRGARKAVTSTHSLKPGTGYQVEARSGDSLVLKTSFTMDNEYVTSDVCDFGAKGGGIQGDALFIQAATMVYPGKSRVLIPAGTYRIASLFLKDNVNIEPAEGVVLSTYTNQTRFPASQGTIRSYDEQDEYNLGTWEGNSLPVSTGIITGVDAKEAVIYGQEIIDGDAGVGEGNWWHEPKVIHTACHPRMIFLERCRQMTVQGIIVRNSPSRNIHPYFSNHLRSLDLKVLSLKDPPNTDGLDPGSCKDMEIAGTCSSMGDDCIAVESGKVYMGPTCKCLSKNISIRRCRMWDGHGSVSYTRP